MRRRSLRSHADDTTVVSAARSCVAPAACSGSVRTKESLGPPTHDHNFCKSEVALRHVRLCANCDKLLAYGASSPINENPLPSFVPTETHREQIEFLDKEIANMLATREFDKAVQLNDLRVELKRVERQIEVIHSSVLFYYY
jgi:hypothetical protein